MIVVLPISTSIKMRPVWARRQRRVYLNNALGRPTEDEKRDAVLVLAEVENFVFAPALHLEAFRILDEAHRG